jgi:hypothetical protein
MAGLHVCVVKTFSNPWISTPGREYFARVSCEECCWSLMAVEEEEAYLMADYHWDTMAALERSSKSSPRVLAS